ncbi:MAG: hypothetical protein U0326_20590 [Polyangiales bacterium]
MAAGRRPPTSPAEAARNAAVAARDAAEAARNAEEAGDTAKDLALAEVARLSRALAKLRG